MAVEADKSCPQCHSDAAVAKASVLYEECTSTWAKQESILPQGWQANPGLGSALASRESRKRLAEKIAPPPMPPNYEGLTVANGVNGVDYALEGGLEGVIIGAIFVSVVGAFIILAKGLIAIGRRLTGREAIPDWDSARAGMQTTSDWQRAMNRWDSLYYCAHCDGVFTPSQGGLVASKQMRSLLYR